VVRGKIVHETRVNFPRARTAELIAGPEAVNLRLELLKHLEQAFSERME
jgi:hypothetical protein